MLDFESLFERINFKQYLVINLTRSIRDKFMSQDHSFILKDIPARYRMNTFIYIGGNLVVSELLDIESNLIDESCVELNLIRRPVFGVVDSIIIKANCCAHKLVNHTTVYNYELSGWRSLKRIEKNERI